MGEGREAMMYAKHVISVSYTIIAAGRYAADVISIMGRITIKSKRIPSIFNDESTGSFICLRRHIYMSHVNKVQLLRVKMIRIAAIQRASLREVWFFIESLLSPV
jgi:hypothetical protein